MNCVRILLATYNGSKYIGEMIDSILAQDYADWQLILSDDGSRDETAEILEGYARKYPNRITHYRSGMRFGNAQDHFMHLLKVFGDAPYIMFCDQDDVWHSDKISKTMEKMEQIEVSGKPAMVHTDLRVVDGQLKLMDPSFMHFSKLDGHRLELKHLLVQNVVTGCTMMINRALAALAVSHPAKEGILMHDWWLALLASAVGTTGYVEEATIDYRQHGNNVVGAKNTRSFSYIKNKLKNKEIALVMEKTYEQAGSFGECFAEVMRAEERELVAQYSELKGKNFTARRVAFIKYSFFKIGASRKIAQMIWG